MIALASQDDVGTFETTNINDPGRVYLDKASEITPFGGETCYAGYDSKNIARMSCNDILQEGSKYSLSYLNIDYYSGFIDGWKSNGCFNSVSKLMGYRFEIQSVNHDSISTRNANFNFSINIKNVGWARLYNQRAFSIILRHKATGTRFVSMVNNIDPRKWVPNAVVNASTTISIPANANLGAYDVLISLPDYNTSLQSNALYNIRFANADNSLNNQAWESTKKEFRLGTTLTIN
jgi:hypothetical protein